MNDSEILKEMTRWLESEVSVYDEMGDSIKYPYSDQHMFNEGILYGRHECADSLLQQMEKWKGDKR